MTASECADWWSSVMRDGLDRLERAAEKRGYGADTKIGFCLVWGSGSLHSATDMFLLDPLRLGTGAGAAQAGGTKWGYLADFGRLTAFIPLGRLPGLASRALRRGANAETALASQVRAAGAAESSAAHFTAEGEGAAEGWAQMAKIFRLADPDGSQGICAWVSLYQALRHTGRYFVKLEELCDMLGIARGAGMWEALANSTAINQLKQLSVILSRLGIKHIAHDLDAFRKMRYGLMQTLEALVPKGSRGALVFGVRWTRAQANAAGQLTHAAEDVGHAMYAARDSKGILRIFDRSGEVVTDLAQLEAKFPGYRGIGRASFEAVDVALWIPDAAVAEKAASAARALGPFGALLIPIFLRPAAMPQRAPRG